MTISQGETSSPPAAKGSLPTPRMSVLLALVTAVQALATFSVLCLPTLAPRAAETFGLGPEVVGYQISIVYLAAASLSSVSGLFVRWWGAGLISIGALIFAGVGLALLSSGSIALTVIGSMAIGCGYALTNPAASYLLFRFSPPKRQNIVFALKQTGVPVGGMLAALTLPALAERYGWQIAVLLGACLLLLAVGPLAAMRSRLDDDRDPTIRATGGVLASLRLVIGHQRLRAFAVMGFAYASFQFCLFAFLVTMLTQDFGWSLIAAGQMATGMQVGGALGRIAWSMIADQIGHGLELLIAIGLGSAGCAWILAIATPDWSPWLLAVVLFSFGFCLVGWNGLWMAEIARSCRPHEVSLATGGVLVFTFAGIVFGPAAFATLYRATGTYTLTYALFSIMALFGVAALVAARVRTVGTPPIDSV